jgi:hypothetical protein
MQVLIRSTTLGEVPAGTRIVLSGGRMYMTMYASPMCYPMGIRPVCDAAGGTAFMPASTEVTALLPGGVPTTQREEAEQMLPGWKYHVN